MFFSGSSHRPYTYVFLIFLHNIRLGEGYRLIFEITEILHHYFIKTNGNKLLHELENVKFCPSLTYQSKKFGFIPKQIHKHNFVEVILLISALHKKYTLKYTVNTSA